MIDTTYQRMLELSPEELVQNFNEAYIYAHGEKKLKGVIQKVVASNTANSYVKDLLKTSIMPSPKGVSILLNTIPYFIFSKPETLCLAGLAILVMWEHHYDPLREKYDDRTIRIFAEFVVNCSKMKLNRNNVFEDFFKRV